MFRVPEDTRRGAALAPGGYVLSDGFWAGEQTVPGGCSTDLDCFDFNTCTCDRCVAGVCQNTPNAHGNVDCAGLIEVADIICMIKGYAFVGACPNADVYPPCTGDNSPLIELADFLKMLDAYSYILADPCVCPP